MPGNQIQWTTDRHIVTAGEAAGIGVFLTWGRHGFAQPMLYGDAEPHWLRELWRVYTMLSWICHSDETVIQGQATTLGELTGVAQNAFAELASAVQGPLAKAKIISDVGILVTHGVYALYWGPVTAGDIIYTRIKYEVEKR